jgi:hypothetical protein
MRPHRNWPGALALLPVLTLTAGAQTGTIEPIAPGVWFREGDLDANYPSGARAVIAGVPKVSSKPIQYVRNTFEEIAQGKPYGEIAGGK